jgi:hypothetical protein
MGNAANGSVQGLGARGQRVVAVGPPAASGDGPAGHGGRIIFGDHCAAR